MIPRNHKVEEALEAATERGDVAPLERLMAALDTPTTTKTCPGSRRLQRRRAAHHARTFCGT
ncbi:MAG: hypothetical protein R2708_08670 [Vicinamibacterales bacterium]